MKNSEKPYFHELPQEGVDKLLSEKVTEQYVIDNYRQPDWCSYPFALSMMWGCWSLCDRRTKISKEYCSDCNFSLKESQ